MLTNDIGRRLFGLAAIGFGATSLAFHDFNTWQSASPLSAGALHDVLLYLYVAATVLGGVAIQFRTSVAAGALALGATYAIFAVLWLPRWLVHPQSYDALGNFFEEFSLVCGAALVYTSTLGAASSAARLSRFAYYGFGVCVVSFTLEQAIYIKGTASFVPGWIPPGQTFWAVATTAAFGLAAIALLIGRSALLAARLTTLMIAGFGILVWLPTLMSDPHKLFTWAGSVENTAILGSAWIVSEYLDRH